MAIRSNQPFGHVPSFLYLKNNKVFSGSHRGMRFVLRCAGEAIQATLWPEPWCLEKTPPENTETREFALNEEGLQQAQQWIEQQYQAQFPQWEAVRRNHDL